MYQMERIPRTRLTRGPRIINCKKKLKDLILFSLEKRIVGT